MKIKRYVDKDMRHILRQVRKDQGPDAVILSNRRLHDGIEVIAAVDYDESLVRYALDDDAGTAAYSASEEPRDRDDDDVTSAVPDIEVLSANIMPEPITGREVSAGDASDTGTLVDLQSELSSMRGLLETQLSGLLWKDNSRRFPLRAQVLRNMARIGLAPDVANTLVDRLEPMTDVRNLWKTPLAELAKLFPVVDNNMLQDGGTIALIGPTGVGKTTTIAKIAARFAMNDWADDIALVSADSFRIGAKEHLTAFANIIGAKVYAVANFQELSDTLHQLKNKKLVLIDTEGRSQRDQDLVGQLAAYGRNADRIRFYLTLSAATQEAALDETVREFSKVPLEGCIVTKIDEAAQLGCVMSTLIRNDLPAALFSDGQRIPDDLHDAARSKLWLVNQAMDCLASSHVQIDERTMAERYTLQSTANA